MDLRINFFPLTDRYIIIIRKALVFDLAYFFFICQLHIHMNIYAAKNETYQYVFVCRNNEMRVICLDSIQIKFLSGLGCHLCSNSLGRSVDLIIIFTHLIIIGTKLETCWMIWAQDGK